MSEDKRPKEDQSGSFECGGDGNRAVSLRETVQCFFAALQNNLAVHLRWAPSCAARGGDLRQADIATAVPVAAVEHRFGGVLSKFSLSPKKLPEARQSTLIGVSIFEFFRGARDQAKTEFFDQFGLDVSHSARAEHLPQRFKGREYFGGRERL